MKDGTLLWWGVGVAMGLLQAVIFGLFADKMLYPRRGTLLTRILLYTAGFELLLPVNLLDSRILNLLCFILFCICASMYLYQNRFYSYLLVTAEYAAVEIIAEIFAEYLIDTGAGQVSALRFVLLHMMSQAFTFCFLTILSFLLSRHKEYRTRYDFVYLVFPAITIFYCFLLDDTAGFGELSALSLLLISNLLEACFYEALRGSMYRQSRNELMLLKERADRRHYKALEEKEELQAGMIHDFRHYLSTIDRLAAEGRQEDIRKLISGLGRESGRITKLEEFGTNNAVLETILSDKKREAELTGTDFTVKVTPCDLSGLMEADICSLFCNLLDNALEAAKKCAGDRRYIHLEIRPLNKAMITIIEKNSSPAEPRSFRGILLSAKPAVHGEEHGLGYRSMERVVERIGGQMSWSSDGGEFTLICCLPVQNFL